MADVRLVKPGIYAKIVDASPNFDLQKIFFGDDSKGEPVGMATEAKNRRQTVKPETIWAIEAVLSKGDRVELIPSKDGVKIIHIKRKEVKPT